MIGGSANRVSAMIVASPARPYGPNGSVPGQSAVTSSASSANVGTARPTLEMLIARNPPRPRWPSQSASGRPISAAISSAVKLMQQLLQQQLEHPVRRRSSSTAW